jgi:tight adherence protein B
VGVPETALLVFAAMSLCALAAGLVIRDLMATSTAAVAPARTSLRLRRTSENLDQPHSQQLFEQIDRGFDRLVLESGSDLTSPTVFLLLVSSGLLFGGCLWLYSDEPLQGIAGGMVGMALPLFGMMIYRSRRLKACREQLPPAIEMLARATRAGQSSEQALSLVANEASGLLAQEFQRCVQQLEMGRSFEKTLKSLASRVRLLEVRILVTTLIVQRQAGGPLSETLERMASVIRDRITAQRQVMAATAAGRMSTLVIASIAPLAALFLLTFQREHVDLLFEDALGRTLLLIGLVLELVGLVWVFQLLKTER